MMYKNFVSKSSIDAKKQERKEFFKDKLKKVQEDYENAKRIKNLEEERGDSKWMLPALDERLKETKGKKKKKKKHKKKEKKHKKKTRKSDSSSEEGSGDEWEEADSTTKKSTAKTEISENKDEESIYESKVENYVEGKADEENSNAYHSRVERDEWMMSSSLLDFAATSTYSRENKTKQRKIEERRKQEEKNKAALESRELNPYYKDGGSGMPAGTDEGVKTKGESTKIGDGGKSWLHKAYDRAVRQAKEQGVSVEEVISKRWGSMEKFNAMLKSADRSSAENKSSSRSSGWRKRTPEKNKGTRQHDPTESDLTSSKQIHDIKQVPQPRECEMEKRTRSYSSSSSSSESESEAKMQGEEEEEETIPLTEKEKNEISAKILRAELMGDDELAEKLRTQLDNGTVRKVKKSSNHPSAPFDKNRANLEQDVILTRTDKHGNMYPIQLQTDSDELTQRRKRKKKLISTHGEDGKRIRYFEDDDNVDLKTMVQQERLTTASDQSAMMSRLASKHLGKAQGDDYTLDDMFVAASATKGGVRGEDKRTREKAIKEHKQRETQLASCRFCFDNPNISKHLIIAIGKKTYLALPINASLTEGHCLILPLQHGVGQTFLDEDVIQEIKRFKECLVKMFSTQDEDIVFLETCKNLRHRNHCVVECIPLPRELGDMAPIYFKKAIIESESEWSQNKKVVDITSRDGITKALPKGLPYFAVEFGMDGGFGHIIEDEEKFPYYFGKEIIGGMLDVEPRLWRKPPKQSFDQHKRKVLQFAEQWKEFDWTKKLN